MQIYARDHVEVHKQNKKEVLYLLKKERKKKNNQTKTRTTEHYGYKL